MNKNELTPLHVAIKSFQNKAIKFALDFNIYKIVKHKSRLDLKKVFDLNLSGAKNQWSPTHYAVYNNNLPAVSLFL
jgi:ankyrin repeat protein